MSESLNQKIREAYRVIYPGAELPDSITGSSLYQVAYSIAESQESLLAEQAQRIIELETDREQAWTHYAACAGTPLMADLQKQLASQAAEIESLQTLHEYLQVCPGCGATLKAGDHWPPMDCEHRETNPSDNCDGCIARDALAHDLRRQKEFGHED